MAIIRVFYDGTVNEFEYVIADRYYHVLAQRNSITGKGIMIDIGNVVYENQVSDTIIRMYYRLITSYSYEFRGHGDILVKSHKMYPLSKLTIMILFWDRTLFCPRSGRASGFFPVILCDKSGIFDTISLSKSIRVVRYIVTGENYSPGVYLWTY